MYDCDILYDKYFLPIGSTLVGLICEHDENVGTDFMKCLSLLNDLHNNRGLNIYELDADLKF